MSSPKLAIEPYCNANLITIQEKYPFTTLYNILTQLQYDDCHGFYFEPLKMPRRVYLHRNAPVAVIDFSCLNSLENTCRTHFLENSKAYLRKIRDTESSINLDLAERLDYEEFCKEFNTEKRRNDDMELMGYLRDLHGSLKEFLAGKN